MEQLIIMKQRIKTVETIKKVTHAMRLISMSAHKKLLDRKKNFNLYKETFSSLWGSVSSLLPQAPEKRKSPFRLCILIGSQKGLCGTFNTSLFKYFEKHEKRTALQVIGIGTYATEYITRIGLPQIAQYKNFKRDEFIPLAHAITELILSGATEYSSVTVYSNKPKTFFVQQPFATSLYPLHAPEDSSNKSEESAFIFEQSSEKLRETLEALLLTITLQELLLESLVSEQAARFISMDSSTRNAENLLTSMKRGYNKLRQAAITRELTELSTSSL